MKNRIKNIINLTKLFFQNSIQFPYNVNKNTKELNKKLSKSWLMIIIMVAITFLSHVLIKELTIINQQELFLNFMFLVLIVILFFQVSLNSMNIYFFSKDLELVLPLPIKPIDLMISKINTILLNIYNFEITFILFPLIIYGIYISAGLMFYIYLFMILLIFPILPTLIVSTIVMIFIKFSKFIKNKDIFQILITVLLLMMIVFAMFYLMKLIFTLNYDGEIINQFNIFNNKLKNINKYFLQINPCIELLNNYDNLFLIINLLKIILIDFIFFIIFIISGKNNYLKNILKNNYFNNIKKIKKINLNKKCKQKNKIISYINKEFKILFKTPVFFIQCIIPSLTIIVSVLIILLFCKGNLRDLASLGMGENSSFNLNIMCLIIAGMQLLMTFSNISNTAISRDGKNAKFMKHMPIDYYSQIILKSMPQIVINLFLILIICILIFAIIPKIDILFILYIFIIANLLNIINSLTMVIVDLKNPSLEWNAEYEVISGNNNKLYQYVLSIIIILLLFYLAKIFIYFNINIACILIILFLLIILIIFNLVINKIKNKLFKNIN